MLNCFYLKILDEFQKLKKTGLIYSRLTNESGVSCANKIKKILLSSSYFTK